MNILVFEVFPLRSVLILVSVAVMSAAESGGELFLTTIQPALARDCQGCHGTLQALSKLDLSTRDGALKGGTRGAAVIVGKADDSLLIQVIEGRGGLQMPPGGPDKKLTPETVAAFKAWIGAGAVWPDRKTEANWSYKPEDLWAFQPLPAFDAAKSIDNFINAKLAERGLKTGARADKRTLIRRATIDLTGLPPTPEEVAAFVADNSPKAWDALIERLLASPRYGERWGRHWLDVTRYADTNGYSNDFERPNAWRYRDYVIRAFNRDMPYDQFVREQIAGDELYPDSAGALIATGFLRSGPWEHTAMSVEAVTRQLFLDDVTHATTNVFLGLTLGCARCHDHKFDPLPTRDYYRMQAIFATTEFARPKLGFLASENTSDLPEGLKRTQALNEYATAREMEFSRKAAEGMAKKLKLATVEDLSKADRNLAMTSGEGLTPEEFEQFKLYRKHTQLYKESLVRFEARAFSVSSGPRDGVVDAGPVAARQMRRDTYKPAAIHILPGGNIQAPAEAVEPGLLSALEKHGGYAAPAVPQTIDGRRSVLAKWIADGRNPLTARVMANRVWQYHFGRGIAADTSNFGKMGKRPTHPELLDWLATSFVKNGWSVKQLHRAIMRSDAYRRESGYDAEANALYAAYAPRRVEAEVLRDSLLAVSGELSFDAGGPGVFPRINEDVARQPRHQMGSVAPPYAESPLRRQRNRRTVYTFQQRSLIDPLVDVFNGPSLDLSCERRETSTVPTQAFGLFNSQVVNDLALAMAVRLEKDAGTLEGRVQRAFELAYGRGAESGEVAAAKRHYEKVLRFHKANPSPGRPAQRPVVHKITSELTGQVFEFTHPEDTSPRERNLHPSDVRPETRALADVTLALLNANEFVYVY